MLARRKQNHPQHISEALIAMSTGTMPRDHALIMGADCPLVYLAGEKDEKFCAFAREIFELNS